MRNIFPAFLFISMIIRSFSLQAQDADPNNGLKHWMTPEEAARKELIGRDFVVTDPPTGIIRNVEEFGPTESVLIRYPFGIPMSLIKEMAKDNKVVTIVASASQQTTVNTQYVSNGVNTANCSYLIAPTDSYWTRDYGPWYISYGDNQFGIVDFPYNRPRPNDDEIPKKVAALQGIPWFGMDVIHTGGNYMTDGLHQSSSTTLVYEENPSQTAAQIGQKMHDYLGIDNYMVEEDPNGTYIDHIDCWGKFLGPDKVLIRKVPASHPQYSQIEATAAFYAAQISSYGTPYRVYRVNTPNNEPYTNSYIMNNKVFVPFMGTANDAGALLSYQQAMPGYQISGYLALASAAWESTDALHCRTHEMADRGMLYIDHMPLSGTQPFQMHYTINADITAYSQQAIYSDSVWVIYKVNGGVYDSIPMVNTSANHYTTDIPVQLEGSTVAYYINAKDASGRSACHPFIGAPDPHSFQVAVSAISDVTVTPDSLIYLLPSDLTDGKTAYVRNYSSEPVTIDYINHQEFGPLFWYVEPWDITLPYTLNPGDSLLLNVKMPIPVAKADLVCDTLFINTVASSHQVMVCVDSYLLSGISENAVEDAVTLFPNPVSSTARVNFVADRPCEVKMDLYAVNGRFIANLYHGNHPAGKNQVAVVLPGGNLSNGLYYYKMSVGDRQYSGKISIVR